ncbi:MAG: hypothetical protein RIR26_328, partial [Pseudomonadota bacterium]
SEGEAMSVREVTSLMALVFVTACQGESESTTASLGTSLKPEGFLVVKDLQPDSAKAGSFLVTCASATATKTTSYTKAEVEQNKICLTGASAAAPSPSAAKPSASQQAAANQNAPASTTGEIEISFKQSTYLKARSGMDVSRNGGSLGTDYCPALSKLLVSSVCQFSATELKVTGVGISGCDLSSGYFYAPHVQLSGDAEACR